MKKTLLAIAALILPLMMLAQEGEPIITFHTTLYEDNGQSNSFSVVLGATKAGTYVDIDCGYGPEELELRVANLDENQEMQGTLYTGKVSEQGTVTIYGDPTKIDYFNASGCGITDIQFHKDLNLQILNLEHNSLKSLNVDDLQELAVLYLMDNPFSKATPLMIGRLPKLLILEMGQIGYVSPDFTLQNFPLLYSYDAYYCTNMTTCDPTGCPSLVRLSLDMTSVSTLDVSQNPNLCILNVSDTRISKLDLSHNPLLQELYITHASGTLNKDVKFSEIDVTQNPDLYHFFCGGNNLTTLDLSQNPSLFTLSAHSNLLTGIDLSHNPDLYSVNLNRNRMNYSTLPSDPGTWGEYYYDQQDLPLNDTYKVGDVIDFSSQVLRAGTTTSATLYAVPKDDPTNYIELDDSYYTFKNGVLTLLRDTATQVFVLFNNSELSEYSLYTEKFYIRSAEDFGKDIKAVEFASISSEGTPVNIALGIQGADTEPVNVQVDFGDGTLSTVRINSSNPTANNITGTRTGYSNIVIYVPQDKYITTLCTDGVDITNINLSELAELETLKLRNAGLYTIDLSYNTKLKSLDLEGNNLYNVSLKGKTYYYYKNQLTDINLSHNNISTFTYDDMYSFKNINLSYNKLEEMDFSDADNLVNVDLSNNLFSELTFTYSEALKSLNVSNNKLTSVYVPEAAELTSLNVSGNLFTLADMATLEERFAASLAAGCQMVYAPQQAIQIGKTSPGVDLSVQCIQKDGALTSIVWKKSDGTMLQQGLDYTIKNGSTKFLKTIVGTTVYAEITHAAYPQFAGENVLRTTLVTPIDEPTVEIASFVTTNTGDEVELSLAGLEDGTSVYFDWNGDGNVTQYTLGTTYRRFSATTRAGAKVRVLVADEKDKLNILSITGAQMSSLNLSDRVKSCFAITIADAGLTEINLPQCNGLGELNLSGNNLTSLDFSKVPNLIYISLNSNYFTTIDLSSLEGLQLAYLGNNLLSEVKMKNQLLWNLDLGNNRLQDIDLSGVPSMSQMWLSGNQLKHVDVSKLKELKVLSLTSNLFDFSTLPLPKDSWMVYNYGSQADLEVECTDNRLDLSYMAQVDTAATQYRWFLGSPTLNEDTEEWEGEELIEGEEYTIENGITTFTPNADLDDIVGLITNNVFPQLTMMTKPFSIYAPKPDALQDVIGQRATRVQRYDLSGRRVSASALSKGLYVQQNKKILVK